MRSVLSSQIFCSPMVKKWGGSYQSDVHHTSPLIILLLHIHSMLDRDEWGFIKGLRDANTNALVISTENVGHDSRSDSTVLRTIGKDAKFSPVYLAPSSTKAQQALSNKDHEPEQFFEFKNIRTLQRCIRRISSNHRKLPIARPYVRWDFLAGTSAQRKLAEWLLSKEEINVFVESVSRQPQNDFIIRTVLQFGLRTEALDEWCSLVQSRSCGSIEQ